MIEDQLEIQFVFVGLIQWMLCHIQLFRLHIFKQKPYRKLKSSGIPSLQLLSVSLPNHPLKDSIDYLARYLDLWCVFLLLL